MTRLACLFVLLVPAVAGADDLKAITGGWKPESVVFNGQERFPDGKNRDEFTLVIAKGEYRLFKVTDPVKDLGERQVTAEIKLDPATKSLTLTVRTAAEKVQKCHGIYELKDGKLRLCYGPAEKPKPTKFEAPEGSFYFCETWTPEK